MLAEKWRLIAVIVPLVRWRNSEAIGISPDEKTVQLRDVATDEMTTESYDKLVLSPGAPFR